MEVSLLYINCLGFLVVYCMSKILISAHLIANVHLDSCVCIVLFPLRSHATYVYKECFYDFILFFSVMSITIPPLLSVEASFRAPFVCYDNLFMTTS